MSTRINAQKSGNWSDTSVWPYGILPQSNDEVFCNGHTITIDQNVEVKSICNLPTYIDILTPGYLIVNDGVTIKSNLICGQEPLIVFEGSSLNIIGNVEGSYTTGEIGTIQNDGLGIIQIQGNVTGGYGGYSYGILNNNTGTINVTGNIGLGLGGFSYAIFNKNNGTIIINGETSTDNGGYGDTPIN